MTYPARKQIYRRRAGPLRYWMLAHVYAGVLAGLVLLIHGGRSTGGLLTSLLMISFDLTILTGLFGIACYLIVPRIMTSIEGEPLLVETCARGRRCANNSRASARRASRAARVVGARCETFSFSRIPHAAVHQARRLEDDSG